MAQKTKPSAVDWGKAEDVTLKYLPANIAAAESGDVAARRRLLSIFCSMVDSGTSPYRALLLYLSRTISPVLNEKGAAEKIGTALLGGPKHRVRDPETEFRHEIAAWEMAKLIAAGRTLVDAAAEVNAQPLQLGLDEQAILKAYKRYAKQREFKRRVALLI